MKLYLSFKDRSPNKKRWNKGRKNQGTVTEHRSVETTACGFQREQRAERRRRMGTQTQADGCHCVDVRGRDFLLRGSQAQATRSKTLSDKSHLKHSVPLAPWKHHGSIISNGNIRRIHIPSVNISRGKLWPVISTTTKQQNNDIENGVA